MSCHQIEPEIVDLARGVTSDQDAQLARHVIECPSCAGRLEQERAMSAALRRLANDLAEPADDPQREQTLLARFDQPRRRSGLRAPVWTSLAAAALAFVAVLTSHLTNAPTTHRGGTAPIVVVAPERQQAQLDPALVITAAEPPAPPLSTAVRSRRAPHADVRLGGNTDSAEFVVWPGATAWPAFESGELIRIDIPTEDGVVQADVLVGQDGFARAIRLVQ